MSTMQTVNFLKGFIESDYHKDEKKETHVYSEVINFKYIVTKKKSEKLLQ